jgi:hypothetical protein
LCNSSLHNCPGATISVFWRASESRGYVRKSLISQHRRWVGGYFIRPKCWSFANLTCLGG